MSTPTVIAAYLALFAGIGALFLLVNLLIGALVRPHNPTPEKLEIYECGEPTIGSSFVQFDLRFYVVALLFLIFDVEVALFFPWAVVFGKANHLANSPVAMESAQGLQRELGLGPGSAAGTDLAGIAAASRQLARLSFVDILVFFAVLMVGFAYVWNRGDLNWVRAQPRPRVLPMERAGPEALPAREPALSA